MPSRSTASSPRRRRASRRSGPHPEPCRDAARPARRAPPRILPIKLPGRVDLDLEPGLAEPARRERVRRVLLRRVADAVASAASWSSRSRIRTPRNLPRTQTGHPDSACLELPHGQTPASGRTAATANATCHDVHDDERSERDRGADAAGASTVCWSPSRRRSGAAELGGQREREAVPGHRHRRRGDEGTTAPRHGRTRRDGDESDQPVIASPMSRSGPTAGARDVDHGRRRSAGRPQRPGHGEGGGRRSGQRPRSSCR